MREGVGRYLEPFTSLQMVMGNYKAFSEVEDSQVLVSKSLYSRLEGISMDLCRDRGVASRSVLLYVRTRGHEETGERREIHPAGLDN